MDQASGAARSQDEHAARYGEVLLEVEQLVPDAELRMEQDRGRDAEHAQRGSREPGSEADRQGRAGGDLHGDGGKGERGGDAELRHRAKRRVEAAGESQTFVDEEPREQQPSDEQDRPRPVFDDAAEVRHPTLLLSGTW